MVQRLNTMYALRTSHVVLLLNAAWWSKNVKSSSSVFLTPVWRWSATDVVSLTSVRRVNIRYECIQHKNENRERFYGNFFLKIQQSNYKRLEVQKMHCYAWFDLKEDFFMFHAENLDKLFIFLPPLNENCLLLHFFNGPNSLQDKTLSSSFLNSLFPLSLTLFGMGGDTFVPLSFLDQILSAYFF